MVESMGFADERRLNVLVLSNIRGNIEMVNKLCDHIIRHYAVDVVFVCGNFVMPPVSKGTTTEASLAAAEGDMTAILSRLEMIVCRVIYIPGPHDPPATKRAHELQKPPRLTPHSVNCDKVKVSLTADIDDIRPDELHASRWMELVVEGSMEDHIPLEVRTEYAAEVLDDWKNNVYANLARLPWCCRIAPNAKSREGRIEWKEKGQLLLTPGWLDAGYFAVLTITHRDADENDGDVGYEVTYCTIERVPVEA
ncbi:hypothetical protein H310_02002 [Aphanomyces invadans]|uniref:Calcineurin-like phosphoesterase domain-containing protein n=1 Tax=Aphanomyces invadans TaxID=157072 RepID=A0A024UM30_9STRA|nr:hypothetical protein H310_02002 [Aphanomyces invadans]ETW07496.1 hypothetical protein H310_02002 [Aphanomyces invadans]|eukprot:XP_008863589.1 hypothetical protein H310_02002 [Aphanomyces invadans]